MTRKWKGILIVVLAGAFVIWYWNREEKPKPVSKPLTAVLLRQKNFYGQLPILVKFLITIREI